MKINFYTEKGKVDRDGLSQIFMFASVGGTRAKFSTGQKVPADKWDTDKQRAKKSHIGSPELNHFLATLENEAMAAYQRVLSTKQEITLGDIREAVETALGRKKPTKESEVVQTTFWGRAGEFMEVKQNELAPRTLKKYHTLFGFLKLQEKRLGGALTFESFTLSFFDQFKNWLLNQAPPRANSKKGLGIETGGGKKPKGMLNDSVAKYLSCLKTFLQWAADRGHHANHDFQKVKFTPKKKLDIVVLSENEVNVLWEADLRANPRLEKVRDLFLFGVHTGQRWSDIEAFRREQIKGQTWDFVSKKTGKRIFVPFVGFAARAWIILQKHDFALPQISSQKFNIYLKELGELVGFDEPITIKRLSGKREIVISRPKYEFMSSHMARRTCVTILLQRGMPPTTIMKLTGHADLRTLMKYEETGTDELGKALAGVDIGAPNLKITKTA